MDAVDYLKNPCAMSSLPLWKTNSVTMPSHLRILRDDEFRSCPLPGHDEPYFRLQHDLRSIPDSPLCSAYELTACSVDAFAEHINACYDLEHVSAEELAAYTARPVFDPSLWIAVADRKTHRIVATGIAELDTDIAEGILEWIQVSPSCRRQGLGTFVVCELLRRMLGKAKFVTVSGRMQSESCPYALYRVCGFDHPVIWHVIST
ncbi:MAG: GNAT family N-acetyltransferase [Clostridia bacterium]|nr:GNAT family N-acetyltransferase [Clostridia bacterium]